MSRSSSGATDPWGRRTVDLPDDDDMMTVMVVVVVTAIMTFTFVKVAFCL